MYVNSAWIATAPANAPQRESSPPTMTIVMKATDWSYVKSVDWTIPFTSSASPPAKTGGSSTTTGAATTAPASTSKPNPWYPDHAVFNANKLERRFRDMHTIAQQIQGRDSHYEDVGKAILAGNLATPPTGR